MKKEKSAVTGNAVFAWIVVALLLTYVFFALKSPIRETKETSILGFTAVAAEATAPSSFSLTLRSNLNYQPMSVSGYCVVQTAEGGYAIAGYSYSPRFSGGLGASLFKISANGSIRWQQTYGFFGDLAHNEYPINVSMIRTSDGGYALAGYCNRPILPPGTNAFLVRTDENGSWKGQQSYDGGVICGANSVFQTSDGGYALLGYNGDNGRNAWLIKTDGNGNTVWNKTYGGTNRETGYSVVQTSDGGYAIAGCTSSYGAGGEDAYLVKTDATGTMLWNQTYGGTGTDYGNSVFQTNEGGYIVAGFTNSFGAGNFDVYLIKTDSSGNLQWSKTYGGINDDKGYSVTKTSDGGYAVTGYTNSFGVGGTDAWLIKTDTGGSMQWNKTYGGIGTEGGNSVIQASDGGYAIAGYTDSFGNNGTDAWLIKTDSNGYVPLPPVIGILSREPAGVVQPSQPVKISANVSDSTSQVRNVTLQYSLDGGGTWQEPILMNYNASTGLCEGVIPGQSVGTTVQFRVVATNNDLPPTTRDGAPYTVAQVIPEYTSILILPIIMIPTLLIALINFKKRKR